MLDAIPYWEEIMESCKTPDDYIFSVGLVPCVKSINPSRITKRWEGFLVYKYHVQFQFRKDTLNRFDFQQDRNRQIGEGMFSFNHYSNLMIIKTNSLKSYRILPIHNSQNNYKRNGLLKIYSV